MMVGQQPAMANLLHCGMPSGPSHPSHPLKHTALHFPHLRATQVVAYYIEQSKANNHAVREAACACIAELMCKASRICPRLAGGAVEMIGLLGIRAALRVYLQLHPLLPLLQVDKQAVAPFVPRLLRALVTCFKDASWPVSSTRQAAGAPAIAPCSTCLYPVPNPFTNLCPTLAASTRSGARRGLPGLRARRVGLPRGVSRGAGGAVHLVVCPLGGQHLQRARGQRRCAGRCRWVGV